MSIATSILSSSSSLHHHRSFFSPTNPNFRFRYSPTRRSNFRSLGVSRRRKCSASASSSVNSFDLPLLPFPPDEVLVPSEYKTLHLYEARFLALLEESLSKQKSFVHFVLQPIIADISSSGESFAAKYACLALIENIERLEIGALVSIRGIGRVSIVDLMQMEPYLRGAVIPIQDDISASESEINLKLVELRESLYDLHNLQIKLKASKDELLQTRIKNSLTWAEREVSAVIDQTFIPEVAERLSFAAFQPVSGCSQSELLSLQREKLRAMDSRDTFERVEIGIKFVKQNIAIVAAKLAIQSVGM
ncbi:Uncharacterized protein M6B38_216875 [Iris pallida]|uniref:Lon N-terminal domain-containing protein n=1 Tax=Iris pallida TaxID=29817 RepID=A0AAX6E0B2_IRIPA|nr:Uncharacterized protein M6B38_216875 [Iris pallida]